MGLSMSALDGAGIRQTFCIQIFKTFPGVLNKSLGLINHFAAQQVDHNLQQVVNISHKTKVTKRVCSDARYNRVDGQAFGIWRLSPS